MSAASLARFDEGFFTSGDGLRLYWRSDLPQQQPRAHVALVHGYGDHTGRYLPTIEALVGSGYAVHSFDYRGHGRADGRRGYCEAWPDYLLDLSAFWGRVRAAAGDSKIFLLGHSHGGLMAVHQWSQGLPGLSGLILSSPFFKLAITPARVKLFAARMLARVLPWAPIPTELQPEQLSRDEAVQRAAREDPLYNRIATPRWFAEAALAQERVMEIAGRLRTPLLLLSGAEDSVAKVETQRAFFDAAGSQDKRYKAYPGMRHEPLNELGREQVFQDISNWISERL